MMAHSFARGCRPDAGIHCITGVLHPLRSFCDTRQAYEPSGAAEYGYHLPQIGLAIVRALRGGEASGSNCDRERCLGACVALAVPDLSAANRRDDRAV